MLGLLSLPSAVVACKFDESATSTEIMPLLNQQRVDMSSPGFQVFPVYYEQKNTYKICLESILLAILNKKANEPFLSHGKIM